MQVVNDLTVRHTPMLPRPLAPEVIRRIMTDMGARDRLIVEWAVTTGIRRMELAALKRSAVPNGGGNPRLIYPPSTLLDRSWAYAREERAVAVRRARTRDPTYVDPDTLFLTDHGKTMTARRVGAMFADAAQRCGIAAQFHSLRHTFASVMLRFLQRQAAQGADLNPLLTLQTVLGHADFATTSIYLRVVATDLGVIEASVDDLYRALL